MILKLMCLNVKVELQKKKEKQKSQYKKQILNKRNQQLSFQKKNYNKKKIRIQKKVIYQINLKNNNQYCLNNKFKIEREQTKIKNKYYLKVNLQVDMMMPKEIKVIIVILVENIQKKEKLLINMKK